MTTDVIDTLVDWVEVLGAAMIMAGIVVTVFRVVRVPFMERRPPLAALQIRLGLGMFLALGLEFLLAADILRTAVAPTWEEIGQLAAIAAIRTGLNFFLGREFIEGEHEIAALQAARLDTRAAGPPGRPNQQPRKSAPAPAPTAAASAPEAAADARTSATPEAPRRRGRWARLVAAVKGPAWMLDELEPPPTAEPPAA
jgi:uncharacterized membrane protein